MHYVAIQVTRNKTQCYALLLSAGTKQGIRLHIETLLLLLISAVQSRKSNRTHEAQGIKQPANLVARNSKQMEQAA